MLFFVILTVVCARKDAQERRAAAKEAEGEIATHVPKGGLDVETVQNGSVSPVDYVGAMDNGDVFDTSMKHKALKGEFLDPDSDCAPLRVTVGHYHIIPGFEEAFIGIKEGESRSVAISPEEACGPVHECLIQDVPTAVLQGAGMQPEAGTTVQFTSRQGRPVSALIRAAKEEVVVVDLNHQTYLLRLFAAKKEVVVDMNHPLAGEILHFRLTVNQVQ